MAALFNQPLSADMGKSVIELLRAMTPLPDRGIVAGQAVTSALLHLYGDGFRKGPINDIDIFMEEARTKDELKMHFSLDRMFLTSNERGYQDRVRSHVQSDLYEDLNLPNVTARATLNITGVGRDSLLNTVMVNPINRYADPDGPRLTTSRVINSFDINCVEAGVDLATGKLEWSKSFEWFSKTSQLQQTNVHGEVHTMLRMLKKLKEMPWMYCDMPSTARSMMFTHHLKVALESINNPELKVHNDGYRKSLPNIPVMGPAYLERYKEFESEISPWFKLSDTVLKMGKRQLFLTEPTFPLDSEEFKPLGSLNTAAQKIKAMTDHGDWSRSTQKKMMTKALGAAVCLAPELSYNAGLVSGAALQKREATLAEAGRHFIAMQTAKIEKTVGTEHEQLPFTAKLDGLFTQRNFQIRGSTYLEGQVDFNSVVALEEFLHSHEAFRRPLVSLKLQDQIQAMKNLKELNKEFDGVGIGLAESLIGSRNEVFPEIYASKEKLHAELKPIFDRESAPMDVPSLPISKEYSGVRVKELLSNIELQAEGIRMSHCVGGYGSSVRNGICRILSFSSGKSKMDASTMEMRIGESDGVFFPIVIQHRGFANGTPPKANMAAGEEAIERIKKKFVDFSFSRLVSIDAVKDIKSVEVSGGSIVQIRVEPMSYADVENIAHNMGDRFRASGRSSRTSIHEAVNALTDVESENLPTTSRAIISVVAKTNSTEEGHQDIDLNVRIPVDILDDGSIAWPSTNYYSNEESEILHLFNEHCLGSVRCNDEIDLHQQAIEVFKNARANVQINLMTKAIEDRKLGLDGDTEVEIYLDHPKERDEDVVVLDTSPAPGFINRVKSFFKKFA